MKTCQRPESIPSPGITAPPVSTVQMSGRLSPWLRVHPVGVTRSARGLLGSGGCWLIRRMALKGRGMRGDWVDLAAILMLLAGSIDGIQGLIAIIRNHYYSLAPNEILLFDLTTWGWILLVWGTVVALAGAGLWLRSEAARWFAVVLLVINLVGELTFAGTHGSTLWARRMRSRSSSFTP